MKNKGNIYRAISIFAILFLLVLSGCTQLSVETSVSTNPEISVEADDAESEVVTDAEGHPIYSIADYDWEIENHPYGGSDNLYELSIDELNVSSNDISIMALKAVDEQFVVICQTGSKAVVYMVNPLTMQITAFCDLPDGTYSDKGVRINYKGEIEIWNEYHHELFVFNKKLQELEHIKIWDVSISVGPLPVSSDYKYVYYVDAEDGYIYSHQTETDTRTRIFTDINVSGDDAAKVLGLLKQDSCLAFRYCDKETKEYTYEIREISTGTVVYHDSGEIFDIETMNDTYMLRHFEDGLSEILFGKEVPQVISLKDYKEYEQVATDIRTESVISCMRKTAEQAGRQELVEQGQETVTDIETQKESSYTFCLYDLASGKRECTLELCYIHELQESPNCKMIYLQEAECVVCLMEDSNIRWLVWDLTKNSSKTMDDTNYIYQWQNPEKPDYERLTQLTQWSEQIGQKNGVVIYFGESAISRDSQDYKNKVSTNVIRIEKMLSVLEKALEKYPEGMLAQLGEKSAQEGHLQIHLVSEIESMGIDTIDTAGYQSSIDGIPYIVLDINCVTQLESMVYHEIFHAIEWELCYGQLYLSKEEQNRYETKIEQYFEQYYKDYYGIDFNGKISYDQKIEIFFDEDEWNYLNPQGFKYDKSYKTNERKHDDEYTADTDDVYFIDVYSKSFPEEDRARIMECAMLDAEDEMHKDIESFIIQVKLKYICREIRRGFDTTGWPEKTVWEMAVIE